MKNKNTIRKRTNFGNWAVSCLKKRRYVSMQVAKEMINRIHKLRSVELRAYFCKYCCGFHLTHTQPHKHG